MAARLAVFSTATALNHTLYRLVGSRFCYDFLWKKLRMSRLTPRKNAGYWPVKLVCIMFSDNIL